MCETFISIIITSMILFFLQSRIVAMDITLHEGSALTVCIQHSHLYDTLNTHVGRMFNRTPSFIPPKHT